jgi:hypothetical protein
MSSHVIQLYRQLLYRFSAVSEISPPLRHNISVGLPFAAIRLLGGLEWRFMGRSGVPSLSLQTSPELKLLVVS